MDRKKVVKKVPGKEYLVWVLAVIMVAVMIGCTYVALLYGYMVSQASLTQNVSIVPPAHLTNSNLTPSAGIFPSTTGLVSIPVSGIPPFPN